MAQEPPGDQLKRDFVKAAFSQFKTPANAVLELAQTLLQSGEDPLNEIQEQYVKHIYRAAQHLLNLVEQCLKNQYLPIDLTDAHQLRTLLYTIIGSSDWLIEGADGLIIKATRDVLICIEKNGESLLCLLNNILDAWRIEDYSAGEDRLYVFEEISLNTAIKKIFDSIIEFYRIEIDVDTPDKLPTIQAEEIRIRQVILFAASALTNRFQQGHLALIASADNHLITLTLTNDQYPLPDDIIADYHRLAAEPSLFACRRFDAVFELLISRALVEIHGGVMALNNCPGAGAKVTLTLPILSSPTEE